MSNSPNKILLRQKTAFSYFRLPDEQNINYVSAEKVYATTDFARLEGRQGFLIAPFEISDRFPLLLLETKVPETIQIPPVSEKSSSQKLFIRQDSIPSDVYASSFQKAYHSIQNHACEKVVLAREECIKLPDRFSQQQLYAIFLNACFLYPKHFVTLFSTPLSGVWLTATPELLLSMNGVFGRTMALAGTMPLSEESLSVKNWSPKNLKEHDYVCKHIDCVLSSYAEDVEKESLQIAQSGNLAHLQTNYQFRLSENKRLGGLLEELYPTPAVCGIPRQESLNAIHKSESFNRGYYAGFSGLFNIQGRASLYVTLRCFSYQEREQAVRLYAGGGIVKESRMEDEWMETCRKLEAVGLLL